MQITPKFQVPKKGKAMLIQYDGIGDLARDMAGFENSFTRGDESGEDRWAGASWRGSLKHAKHGDLSHAGRSDKLLEKIEHLATFVSTAFQVQHSVTGGVPNIPSMLAGHPAHMRLRRRVLTQQAPLAIIIDATVSAGVEKESIERRGAAALALVRVLSAVRPITLYVAAGLKTHGKSIIVTVPINTAPLDLARAAWALGAPDFLRRAIFSVIYQHLPGLRDKHTDNIPWCFSDPTWQTRKMPALVAEMSGCSEHLAIAGVTLGTDFASDEAALRWVENNARELSGQVLVA